MFYKFPKGKTIALKILTRFVQKLNIRRKMVSDIQIRKLLLRTFGRVLEKKS